MRLYWTPWRPSITCRVGRAMAFRRYHQRACLLPGRGRGSVQSGRLGSCRAAIYVDACRASRFPPFRQPPISGWPVRYADPVLLLALYRERHGAVHPGWRRPSASPTSSKAGLLVGSSRWAALVVGIRCSTVTIRPLYSRARSCDGRQWSAAMACVCQIQRRY